MSPAELSTTTIYLSPDALGSDVPRRFERLCKQSNKDIINLPIEVTKKQLNNLSMILTLTDTSAAIIAPAYSSAIVPIANYLSPTAKACGAVDFVILKNRKLTGHFLVGEALIDLAKGMESLYISNEIQWATNLRRAARSAGIKLSKSSSVHVTKDGKLSSKRLPMQKIQKKSWELGINLLSKR